MPELRSGVRRGRASRNPNNNNNNNVNEINNRNRNSNKEEIDVGCSPYYLVPQTNLMYYHPRPPHHNYSTPAADDHDNIRSSKVGGNIRTPGIRDRVVPPVGYYPSTMMMNTTEAVHHHHGHDDQHDWMEMKTLNLFPVHPTGILEHKDESSTVNNNSSATNTSYDDTYNTNDNGSCYKYGPDHVFDFFSAGIIASNSSTESTQ